MSAARVAKFSGAILQRCSNTALEHEIGIITRSCAASVDGSSGRRRSSTETGYGMRGVGSRDERTEKHIWSFPKLAAGALSFSFAFSSVSAALTKERVALDRLPEDVVLYQYEACPFCNKVKAFLDYHDIPYQVVEVNPVGKKELRWSEYKKLPVLVVDGQQLNDSTEIISSLNARINPVSENSKDSEEERWRKWVDDHLVHLLSPNIYRTPKEALEAFGYISDNGNFSAAERVTGKYVGAAAMYFISKRLKKRHNISDERASLYEAAEVWVQALDNRSFMGGSKPNLADLAVFGVLRPVRNLQTGIDLIENTSIGEWYTHMEEAVGPSSRLQK